MAIQKTEPMRQPGAGRGVLHSLVRRLSLKLVQKRSLQAAAVFLPLLVLLAVWLKSEYTPSGAVQVSEAFIQKLEAKQFEQAFELTVKQGYVGRTPNELRDISGRELCKIDRRASTFPFQSNGNRLRRLVTGMEVEMPQVQVEFSGACLFGVTVRRTAGNTWRVFRFASHAG